MNIRTLITTKYSLIMDFLIKFVNKIHLKLELLLVENTLWVK